MQYLVWTKVELYFISDITMYLFLEGIRRSVSYISKTYSKTNNKYLTYDPQKPTKYFTYLEKIIFVAMLCQNLFRLVDLSG